jgi:diguanylate cyclase (GGDEF)-like protein/PAS domain S-box-containing protein
MNPFSVELTGFTPEEYLAADDCLAMMIAEDDLAKASRLFQEALQGSRGDNVELRIRRKDGSTFWVATSWRPILDADGRSLGIRTSSQDITASKQAREELARARARLETANRQLAALSTTDSLTGIANRRHFDAFLLSEWRRATRTQRPLALAMLDVDWFKAYNDHYGHQAGDTCLQAVARVLQTKVNRVSDLAARYGGEEFALIVAETDTDTMRNLAEQIRAALESLALPHTASPLGRVTVSLGVAVLVPAVDLSPEELVRRADAALYRAKAQGRNRVVLATDTP